MKNLKKYLVVYGLAIIAIGFLYDSLFAGIPPQDPPKIVAEKYNQQVFIADLITKLGLFVTFIGIVFRLISIKESK